MYNIRVLISLTNVFLTAVVLSTPKTRRWVLDDNGCRTPNGEPGNCVRLSQCPTLQNLSSNRNEWKILRHYFCAYGSSVLLVCCPKQPIKDIEYKETHFELLPKECGAIQSIDRITNGQRADLFEFPWQVALKYEDEVNPFGCAGTLINDRYVLTAAYCTRDLRLIGVRLGEYNFEKNPDCQMRRNYLTCAPKYIDIEISKKDITEHPNYVKSTYRHDIALIRLPRKVQFSESVSPICLPIKQIYIKQLGNFTVIGWGRTQTNKPNPILLKVTAPFVSTNSCRTIFRRIIDISDNQFCAGGKRGRDSCKGDSGGPIMYAVVDDGKIRWVQAGIVSFGSRFCGIRGVPTVYTKLTVYVDWIIKNLRQ